MRIAGLDPGKHHDSFAFVGIVMENDKIYVEGTIGWQGKTYLQVEEDIARIHQKNPFDCYVVEQNNTGTHVIEVLRYQKQLPVVEVTTSKSLRNFSKRDDIMDKNDMVRWLIQLNQEGNLIFPTTSSNHMKELKNQFYSFSEHKTDAGSVSYRASGKDHDDYVMALILACWHARKFLNVNELVLIRASQLEDVDTLNKSFEEGKTGIRWERK